MLRQIPSDPLPRLLTLVNAMPVGLWESPLRLFHDEPSNVGNELIAVTVLQQMNRVHRSAKKAGAHQGKDYLGQGCIHDAPVEGVEPCLV